MKSSSTSTPKFFNTSLPVRSSADPVTSTNVCVELCKASPSSDVKLVRCVQLQYATPATVSVRQ